MISLCHHWRDRAVAAEARLGKVPALVAAAENLAVWEPQTDAARKKMHPQHLSALKYLESLIDDWGRE